MRPLSTSEGRKAKSDARADSFETNELPRSKEQLRFEVNHQSYMLSLNNENGRWYLLTSSITGGIKAIPVIDDEFGFVANTVVPVGDAGSAIVN